MSATSQVLKASMFEMHRNVKEQSHLDNSEEVFKSISGSSSTRDTSTFGASNSLRNSTATAAFLDVASNGSQGNTNMHTAFRYGGNCNGVTPTISPRPSLPVLRQWHSQSQLQLPPHSPGSLASLLPASPMRSSTLMQGLPPMPCSSRSGKNNTPSQLCSDAVQRQLLHQHKYEQNQQASSGGLNVPRRTASFDGGAVASCTKTSTAPCFGSFSGHNARADQQGPCVVGPSCGLPANRCGIRALLLVRFMESYRQLSRRRPFCNCGMLFRTTNVAFAVVPILQ